VILVFVGLVYFSERDLRLYPFSSKRQNFTFLNG
jgi:hypothetical protein